MPYLKYARQYPFELLTLAAAGLACAYIYLLTVYPACATDCAALHRSIIDGTAASPYLYRVLSVFAVEALAQLIPGESLTANAAAYTVGHALAMPAMLIAVWVWLRTRVTAQAAMTGALLLALLTMVGVQNWGISLYTPVEVALFAVGLLVMDRPLRFVLVIALSALNRETAFVLVAVWAVKFWPWWRYWRYWVHLVGYSAVFVFVYGGLMLLRGAESNLVSIGAVWAANTGYWLPYALLHNLIALPIWLAAWLTWRSADRRLLLALAPYVVMVLAFGQWHEIRLWFVPFVMLLPALLQRFEGSVFDERLSSAQPD